MEAIRNGIRMGIAGMEKVILQGRRRLTPISILILRNSFIFAINCSKKNLKKAEIGGGSSDAPCMIVFCAFEQIQTVLKYAEKYGFKHHIPLVFCKNYSPQVLKANMRICGATEYALVLYRDKLPKFRNKGRMVFNWFEWKRDNAKIYPKIHPAQKPVGVLKRLVELFTDEGDVVIDPCAGSGTTLRAAAELGRNAYGFEVSRDFYKKAKTEMLTFEEDKQLSFDFYI